MRRTGSVTFEVTQNERITITVTPVSVGSFVAASHDGHPLVDEDPTEESYVYVFDITEIPGNAEIVKIAVHFVGDETDNARYEFTVADGAQTIDLSPIPKPSGVGFVERTLTLMFEVA